MHTFFLSSTDFVNTVHEKKTGAELAGSWTVEIGPQDEASKFMNPNQSIASVAYFTYGNVHFSYILCKYNIC